MPTQETLPNQTQTLGGMPAEKCACENTREKYWNELSPGEQIERMRSIVKGLREQQEQTSLLLARIAEDFSRHQHKDGPPLITPGFVDGGLNRLNRLLRSGRSETECYF